MDNPSYFVAGIPVTFSTSRDHEWRDTVKKHVPYHDNMGYIGVDLEFVLPTFAPRNMPLDTDNLCEPVFFALTNIGYFSKRRGNIRWWRASKKVGSPTGVNITLYPDMPASLNSLLGQPIFSGTYYGEYPKGATDPSIPEWLKSKGTYVNSSPNDRLALSLAFGDSRISIGNISSGAVKSTIDCLFPIIGGNAGAPDDHKIDLIQVEKDPLNRNPGSCVISIWIYEQGFIA